MCQFLQNRIEIIFIWVQLYPVAEISFILFPQFSTLDWDPSAPFSFHCPKIGMKTSWGWAVPISSYDRSYSWSCSQKWVESVKKRQKDILSQVAGGWLDQLRLKLSQSSIEDVVEVEVEVWDWQKQKKKNVKAKAKNEVIFIFQAVFIFYVIFIWSSSSFLR